jgi:pectate lyase
MRIMGKSSARLILAACAIGGAHAFTAEQLAFPSAEGFGRLAKGGRGGEVYRVTNLNDSGHGSLRDAVSKGPRIVVFDVGGYVELKSILHVASNITLAGQTAPGDGIGTRNYEVSCSDSHNVIIRYIRFRQGLTPNQTKKSAVNITKGHDIIFDHVSIEWGRWDTVDMNGCTNITFQYSIIGEGIAPQRFGCLCQSENVTFSHNLWINHHSRNPKSKGKVQFINNVIYNWELDAYIAGASHGENWHDVIGNYFIKGPSTGHHGAFDRGNEKTHIYAKDNVLDDNKNGKLDGALVPEKELGPVTIEKQPFADAPVKIDTAEEGYKKVADGAGCSLHRDAVDARLIEDLKSLGKRGKIISDPEEVGGFGELKGGVAPVSSIGDGISDAWKTAHGIDLKNAAAAHEDFNHDGYTNIEKYINELAKDGAVK